MAVQNEEQAAACAALGLPHAVLPNIVEPPPPRAAGDGARRDVIWAGNVLDGRRSKGLEELVALAGLLPAVGFTVAGRSAGVEPRRPGGPRAPAQRGARRAAVARDDPAAPGRAPAGHQHVAFGGFLQRDARGLVARTPVGDPGGEPQWPADRRPPRHLRGRRPRQMAAAIVALLDEPAARAAMAGRCREYVAATHDRRPCARRSRGWWPARTAACDGVASGCPQRRPRTCAAERSPRPCVPGAHAARGCA